MRKLVLPLVGALGLFVAACLTAPGEPSATSTSALSCGASQHTFNGECRPVCTTSAQCSAPSTCMIVAPGTSLCLDYSACAYLGSDTTCAGISYGGYEGSDPYWTPDYEPYASPYSSYLASDLGCGGNAAWHTAPPAAGADPRCGQDHPVVRCQKVGNKCSLVSGTTMDTADR